MRPFSEYILLFGIMISLFISYLVITLRTDDIDYQVLANQIPGQSVSDITQLYIEPGCTSGSYASFKNAGSFYSNNDYELIISSLQLPSSSAAAGTLKLGYADTTVACGSIPTNPVQVYATQLPQIESMQELDIMTGIPKGKYIYIYLSGFNYSAAAVGVIQD